MKALIFKNFTTSGIWKIFLNELNYNNENTAKYSKAPCLIAIFEVQIFE